MSPTSTPLLIHSKRVVSTQQHHLAPGPDRILRQTPPFGLDLSQGKNVDRRPAITASNPSFKRLRVSRNSYELYLYAHHLQK